MRTLVGSSKQKGDVCGGGLPQQCWSVLLAGQMGAGDISLLLTKGKRDVPGSALPVCCSHRTR